MEDKLILDKNGYLVLEDNSNMDINMKIRGKNFNFNNEYGLVYHKGIFILKRILEIGDGMILPKFLQRPEMCFQTIHKEAFIMGMGVFQEFDEDTGHIKSYLYKFDKGEIQEFNELFNFYGIQDCKVRLDGKFVLLDYEIPSFSSIKVQLTKWMEDICYNEIMSFMFGLVMVYGNLHIEQGDLKTVKLHIPLIGGLFNQKQFFDSVFDFCWQIGIPNKIDLQIQKIGHIYQVTFLDWEILNIFSNYLKGLSTIEQISKLNQVNHIKETLIEYLKKSNNFVNINEILPILERKVMKIIEK